MSILRVGYPHVRLKATNYHLPRPRDGHSKGKTPQITSFKEDVKLSTLAWHIQHEHPVEYQTLLSMGEEELSEVAEEMSRVRG